MTFSVSSSSLLLHPSTTVGVNYSPAGSNTSPSENVVTALKSLKISAVRLLNPTPWDVGAFSDSNISLLLTVPNSLVGSFASSFSAARVWVFQHILPFHPRVHISLISVGSDVISSPSSGVGVSNSSAALVPAMRNLHRAPIDVGIRTSLFPLHSPSPTLLPHVSVSTTFSFTNVITTPFPPSAAGFVDPLVMRPVLQFLEETNSSVLMNVYPYHVFRVHGEIPYSFALFEQSPYNYIDDNVTGVRYQNLFDIMVDAVISAMAVSGYGTIPLIVAETGWPVDRSMTDSEVLL